MALLFPTSPAVGTLYPANPGTSGVSQYIYDGTKWNTVPTTVSLGSPNQGAYNDYQWPATSGAPNEQLTSDGLGNLSWEVAASPSLQVVAIDPTQPFDGTRTAFDLVEFGTTTLFTPTPADNIVVFLGGVPQTPVSAFTVSGSTITFTEAPLLGTTFYAISSVLA